MKPVVLIPEPVLSTIAAPVTNFDASLATLVAHMKKTLLATDNPKGVGLAAPQIGESLRLFITKPTEKAKIRVFINPQIIKLSEKLDSDTNTKMEGCLSIPNVWGNVQRATSLTLQYQDLQGETHEEHFRGFLATIIQHETDHINGILFTRRVVEQQGKLFQVIKKDNKEELEEIPL